MGGGDGGVLTIHKGLHDCQLFMIITVTQRSSLIPRLLYNGNWEWDYSLSRLAASEQVFGANSSGHPSTVCRGKSTAGTCPSKMEGERGEGKEGGRKEGRKLGEGSEQREVGRRGGKGGRERD